MAGYSSKAFSEPFSVAVLAAGADLRAAAHWIPSGIGPLDCAAITHKLPSESWSNIKRKCIGSQLPVSFIKQKSRDEDRGSLCIHLVAITPTGTLPLSRDVPGRCRSLLRLRVRGDGTN